MRYGRIHVHAADLSFAKHSDVATGVTVVSRGSWIGHEQRVSTRLGFGYNQCLSGHSGWATRPIAAVTGIAELLTFEVQHVPIAILCAWL